jgi:transcriptional regulator of acetoin/glycerol metabolism
MLSVSSIQEHAVSGALDRVSEQELGACLQGNLQKTERETILAHLKSAKWNVSKAARSLGVSRNTLYRKMKTYGIDRH